jgi:adenosylhomocysteine nucleosidase
MILVATGLKREARILAGPGVRVVAGGGDSGRLERELEAGAAGASAIVSMGLCGALAEGLRPGDWVVGERLFLPPLIPAKAGTQAFLHAAPLPPDSQEKNLGPCFRGDERIFECDRDWAAALAKALNARAGAILASDAMLADAAAKRDAHAATGAIAVDMESHIAATVATRHGLPFAIARVVSDAADRSLPKAAQAGMAADGSMDIAAVLLALARDPRQLPALTRVGREAETAFQALRRGRDLLGPGIGRLDLG